MNPRQQDFYGELDELELGERVSDCLFTELARWLGMAPSLDDVNTICLQHLKEVRRAS